MHRDDLFLAVCHLSIVIACVWRAILSETLEAVILDDVTSRIWSLLTAHIG